MKHSSAAFLFLFFGITKCFCADTVLTYTQFSKKIQIGNHTGFIIDSRNSYILKQVLDDTSKIFHTQPSPNLGLSNNTYWAVFHLANLSSDSLILRFNQPLLHEVTLYRINGKNISQTTCSETKPFTSRKYYYASYAFDLNANAGDTITYVLKFNSNKPIIFDVNVASTNVAAKEELQQEIITGIYIGILFVMFFYNLFIYFTIRDPSYLAYVCYIIFMGLTHVTLPGYSFKYIWPDYPAFNDLAIILFITLASISAIEFVKVFLKTKQHTPLLNKCFSLFEIMFIAVFILHFIGNKLFAFSIVQLGTFVLSLVIIGTAVKIISIGYRPAVFFLIAWIVLLISACIYIAKDFDMAPYNFFTIHAMQIGSGLEVIFLSFALADRINILKKEKENLQTQTLEALRQNELIVKNQNILLEKQVEERTKELQHTNDELFVTIANLKQTQTQLISSEKMASLGHLTAGIVHEINNPINFVVSNVKPLKKDIEDIYELIQKYETIDPVHDLQNKIEEINSFRNEIDYAYLKNEIGSLLKGIEDGAERTAGIVQGLKTYSRPDENDFKRADITEGINSSLTLLNKKITTAEIQVIKTFSPLPLIECFPGKLNQAFLNILNYVLYTIEEHVPRKKAGQINITTSCDNYTVYVSILNNCPGITDEEKDKIFEPFAKTKETGEDIGLGMSIALSIIHEHNGKILLNGTDKGTECIVSLPINYTSKD
ncbi:MAG: sensor histidine kinase [Cytophaga sp.]|uniref:sensor histidine kinase n=1 Tax=Cytophaga sp. TaxID=29535 RepID=UPI003F813139